MSANNNLITVTFRNHVMPDEQASKTAGRPIFSEIEVCDIFFAANSKTKATFPAHEPEPTATRESIGAGGGVVTYAMVYNEQYLAFKRGEAQPMHGTPLAEAPFLTEAKRRELKALNIHTVDALASLDGNPLKQLGMGGRELKNQARAYLDAAAGSADVTSLAAENASLREQMADMQAQMADLITATRAAQRAAPLDLPAEPVESTADDETFTPPDMPTAEEIDDWTDAKLKDFIGEQTGTRPKGNPSSNTLREAAKELAAV